MVKFSVGVSHLNQTINSLWKWPLTLRPIAQSWAPEVLGVYLPRAELWESAGWKPHGLPDLPRKSFQSRIAYSENSTVGSCQVPFSLPVFSGPCICFPVQGSILLASCFHSCQLSKAMDLFSVVHPPGASRVGGDITGNSLKIHWGVRRNC